MDKKVPVLLLVGFLGSGKTSLLNHILKENQGLKVGVIINDFGSINVDSLLVSRQTDSKLELSNGCICCSAEEGGFDDALVQLAHAGASLDYIIVEASGLAEPQSLRFMLEHTKNKYARLDATIAVVDAENVMEMKEKHPDFFSQLSSADIIVVNKIGLVASPERKKVMDYVAFLNPGAKVQPADYGKVDTRLLLDIDASERKAMAAGSQPSLTHSEDDSRHDTHIHASYQKIDFQTKKPLDPQAFEGLLNSGRYPGLYRAKGFAYFGLKGLEQKFALQLVGKRYELKQEDWRGSAVKSQLVFIGQNLEGLEEDLQACIDAHPDDIAGQLMDLTKYR